jgi:predicted transcriptional regulator
MSQITIVIPDDTNRQLSIAAEASRQTIEQFIQDLILKRIAQMQADEQDVQETFLLRISR